MGEGPVSNGEVLGRLETYGLWHLMAVRFPNEEDIRLHSRYSHLYPSMGTSCRLILVAVLDAAEYIALNFQLFAALDKAFLALPIDVVDVFLS